MTLLELPDDSRWLRIAAPRAAKTPNQPPKIHMGSQHITPRAPSTSPAMAMPRFSLRRRATEPVQMAKAPVTPHVMKARMPRISDAKAQRWVPEGGWKAVVALGGGPGGGGGDCAGRGGGGGRGPCAMRAQRGHSKSNAVMS